MRRKIMSKSEIHRKRIQKGERPSQDIVKLKDIQTLNLKKENANLKTKWQAASKEWAIETSELKDLIKLIHKDLKMRVNEEGVVDISGFIWDRINEVIGNEN